MVHSVAPDVLLPASFGAVHLLLCFFVPFWRIHHSFLLRQWQWPHCHQLPLASVNGPLWLAGSVTCAWKFIEVNRVVCSHHCTPATPPPFLHSAWQVSDQWMGAKLLSVQFPRSCDSPLFAFPHQTPPSPPRLVCVSHFCHSLLQQTHLKRWQMVIFSPLWLSVFLFFSFFLKLGELINLLIIPQSLYLIQLKGIQSAPITRQNTTDNNNKKKAQRQTNTNK